MRSVATLGGSATCVLCYHAVTATWDDELAVHPQAFEAQIRSILRAGYVPSSIEAASSGSGKRLHVTFDDAFRNITGALELLASLGVPATIFVCTDLAEAGDPLRVDELAGARAAPEQDAPTLTWRALRDLAASGVGVGSHTCSHPHLTRISDAELHRELRDSRARVEDELGQPCGYLAYPYGEHDARVRAAASSAGYLAAFAQTVGVNGRYAIYRSSVYRSDALWRMRLKTTRLWRMAARFA